MAITTVGAVKIGASFFAKAKKDYANWRWAWVRELFQNSIDAKGTKKIEISVGFAPNGVDTVVTWSNDGEVMSEEVLLEKFLAIGESGKGSDSIGGFGKAKEIIAFAHKSYYIRTGDVMVQGSGGDFTIATGLGFEGGVTTQVMMEGDEVSNIASNVRNFVRFLSWDGVVVLNGVTLECGFYKGSFRREFSWGSVYTNNSAKNWVVVRVNGLPMFTTYTSLEKCVVIELKGSSVEVLTANRDSMVWKYRSEYEGFIRELATDKVKALSVEKPSYVRFPGDRYCHSLRKPDEVISDERKGSIVVSVGSSDVGSGVITKPLAVGGVVGSVVKSLISEEFILKNETELVIPSYYQPDSGDFGDYSKKLVRVWGKLLLELYRLFERECVFSVGFVFSADSVAQFESGDYGVVYFLNPAVIVQQVDSVSKSFKKRWKLTDRNEILAVAVHEFVHSLGFLSHDDNYAAKLTEVFGVVMNHRKRFNSCFS